MEPFYVKRGELEPMIELECLDGNGNPAKFPEMGATSPLFHLRASGAVTPILDGVTATIVDATAAIVGHDWQTGETDHAPDAYQAEVSVLKANGRRQRWPNPGFHPVRITERI